MINKFILFILSVISIFKKKICPNCNYHINKKLLIIDKKYNLKLIECPQCNLRFVHPIPLNLSNIYYDLVYKDGHTTKIDDHYLDYLNNKSNDIDDITFKNKISRYSNIYIPLFKKFNSYIKNYNFLDFGSSWGYGSIQFKKYFKKCYVYDVSKTRLEQAVNNFGLEYLNQNISYDFIVSIHVIEHLSDFNLLNKIIDNNLSINGYLLIACPNGSDQFKKLQYQQYRKLWGFEHPNFISDNFLKEKFKKKFKFKIFSIPMEQNKFNINLKFSDNFENEIYNMEYSEIIFIGKKIA